MNTGINLKPNKTQYRNNISFEITIEHIFLHFCTHRILQNSAITKLIFNFNYISYDVVCFAICQMDLEKFINSLIYIFVLFEV